MNKSAKGRNGRKAAQGPLWLHLPGMVREALYDTVIGTRHHYVKTTDSDHGGPIFPNLARDIVLIGPNQLWVADLTYIAIAHNFAYLAVILDAWSRRVVGYALARFMDSRLTLRSELGNRGSNAAAGMHPSFGSWIAVRGSGVSRTARGPRTARLNGMPQQPLR